MSFRSYEDSQIMHNSMDDAYANGVLLLGGAGNEDTTELCYPGGWESVIQVGATIPFTSDYTPRDEVRISGSNGYFWGSNYGPKLEVMGFGEYYITTYGAHYSAYWDGIDPGFFNGTSCATPMAAGAYALVKSYFPGESPEWLRERMRETADDLNVPGRDNQTGYGRVNVIRACYGADRFADLEDSNGFVDMAPFDGQLFDSLNNQTSGNYMDSQDLYKITSDTKGFLLVDLDIFTWGENLDLEIYSDPSLAPQFLLGQSIGPNHADSSYEACGANINVGNTIYIKVFAPNVGDSTSYGLKVKMTENGLDILDSGTNDPGFIHNGKQNTLLGYIDLDASFGVHLTEMILTQSGTMPADKISAVKIYMDTNKDGTFNGGDTLLGSKNYSGTNRFVIGGMNLDLKYQQSPFRFFVLADIGDVSEDASFNLQFTSYKDISTSEKIEIPYDQFPVIYGPFTVGVDTVPPYWESTTGIQSATPKYAAALVQWNSASDLLTPPVKYNVYWTQTLPFNFSTANKTMDVGFWNGTGFDHAWQINGLVNGQTYYAAVRAEDQAGNEETNTVYLQVIPDMTPDPTSPVIVGSVNTPGNAWEVAADPAHERVFVADYDGGVAIIDVSSPSAPSIIDTVSGTEVTGVEYNGTYVYAVGYYGLYIINPDAPGGASVVGTASIDSALDVRVVGNWAYVTDFGTSLYPVNVTNPASPVVGSSVTGGSVGYGIDSEGSYLYIAYNDKPRVYSIADPAAPSFIKSFGGNGAYEIDSVGTRIYVTYWGGNRVSIYDSSNPADPQFKGYYTSTTGTGGSDIVWLHNVLYFGTNDYGIEVINVDNWASAYKIGGVSTDGPDGMDTDGTFIYSAENEDGLKIIL
ncbi:MAG: S8 family serine peptidase [bacterium]|nr:S8 family serine peptidase [bacterium]